MLKIKQINYQSCYMFSSRQRFMSLNTTNTNFTFFFVHLLYRLQLPAILFNYYNFDLYTRTKIIIVPICRKYVLWKLLPIRHYFSFFFVYTCEHILL